MSKEKTLEDLLEEYASKGISKSEPPKKKSFLVGAKKSIQEHREVKAAARKAEQERIEKSRKEAAAKAERERPVQISLSVKYLSEANIIKTIRKSKGERPLEIVIDIGSYREHGFDNELEGTENKKKVEKLTSQADAILTAFDNTYGTYHTIKRDIKKEKPKQISYQDTYTEIMYVVTTHDETGHIKAILYVSSTQQSKILQKFITNGLNNKYPEAQQTKLLKAITDSIAQKIDIYLTQAYNKEISHYDIFFFIRPQEIKSNIFSPIKYFDLGFGTITKDAMYAIALLTEEYTQACCYSSPYFKSIQLYHIEENINEGATELKLCVRFVPKPNTDLKKF